MRKIKVYKDRSNDTWFWSCQVPFCLQTHWSYGHRQTLKEGIEHLSRHSGVGFSRVAGK